jgi:hypothetical protein
MNHPWDEFSKSLAESVPRRESLRRLGAVFAGAVLAPAGLGALWARPPVDPCKAFCNQCPKQKRSQCLAACQACSGNTSRLCGSCGNYTCCASGSACCGGACVDFNSDESHCGGCGNVCNQPGANEVGLCLNGECDYQCIEGAVRCDGTCTFLWSDPNHCGACGIVCGGDTPDCLGGVCGKLECPEGYVNCGSYCADLWSDNFNCGACGFACAPLDFCSFGTCAGVCVGCE